MNFDLSEMLEETRKSLLKGAAAAFFCALAVRLFAPKPTTVQIDGGIPTEIYTLGKKGNPKVVYVSTKKHHINLLPAVFMLAAALAASEAKKQLDEIMTVSPDKQ